MERDKREPYEIWLEKQYQKENTKLKRKLRKKRYEKVMGRIKEY